MEILCHSILGGDKMSIFNVYIKPQLLLEDFWVTMLGFILGLEAQSMLAEYLLHVY